jgi:hypothetical protein
MREIYGLGSSSGVVLQLCEDSSIWTPDDGSKPVATSGEVAGRWVSVAHPTRRSFTM